LGKRKNITHRAHNIPFVALGVALLWFGWYGFNAGSALAANGQAAAAFVNTQVAPAMAMVTWLFLSWIVDKRPSIVGALTGAVAGLVAITPAAGYVTGMGALIIGIGGAIGCFYAMKFRAWMQWDDALDVWGCHGIGGVIGSILTGVFAAKSIGGFSGLLEGNTHQFIANLEGTAIAVVFAFVATYVLLQLIKLFMPLAVDLKEEQENVDQTLHGEEAYDF
jgi:Amt family ammonium transporter